MEFEKIFKKILFVGKKGLKNGEKVGAKKKYAYILLWEDKKQVNNEIKFTGFESRRSDSSRISRRIQYEVVNMILNGVDKQKIIDKIKRVDEDIRSKKIPTIDIGFPKGISKPIKDYGKTKTDKKTGKKVRTGIPPVVAGSIYSNNYLGTRFNVGSKPMWIYIKKVPFGYPSTRVLSFDGDDVPKDFIIDYDIMIEKVLKSNLEEILLASGFDSFPNTDVRQKTL